MLGTLPGALFTSSQVMPSRIAESEGQQVGNPFVQEERCWWRCPLSSAGVDSWILESQGDLNFAAKNLVESMG